MKKLFFLLLCFLLGNAFCHASNKVLDSQEHWCYNGKVELWSESFGSPENPAILMIMGAMNQGILWPNELCHRLASQGFFVVRYDHRDVGQSSTVNFSQNPYDLNTLKEDALMILDNYQLPSAHILGVSMGGVIGGQLAFDHPERVQSLILMMSSPDLSSFLNSITGMQLSNPSSLPPPSPEFLNYLKKKSYKRGKDEEEKIRLVLEGWRICNGNHLSFPEEEMYQLQQKVRQRSRSTSSAFNHILALFNSDLKFHHQLQNLTVPTLVIHGKQDPCFPLPHGESLSQLIKGSELEVLEEMGHFVLPELSEKISHLVSHHAIKVREKKAAYH